MIKFSPDKSTKIFFLRVALLPLSLRIIWFAGRESVCERERERERE